MDVDGIIPQHIVTQYSFHWQKDQIVRPWFAYIFWCYLQMLGKDKPRLMLFPSLFNQDFFEEMFRQHGCRGYQYTEKN